MSHRAYEIRRFVRSEDLTAVAAVYAAYNAGRSLTTVRPPAYWERHFSWIAGEIEEGFLVAEREGQIVAYSRCEGGGQHLTVSESCYLPGHEGAAVELFEATLTFAAKRRIAAVGGHFPSDHPALSAARERSGFSETESSVLLFRLVNLRRLLERLRPLLAERAGQGGIQGDLALQVGDQTVGLCVRPGWVEVRQPAGKAVVVPPAAFFSLLFGEPVSKGDLGRLSEETERLLAGLFPCEAPVYWRTDVV